MPQLDTSKPPITVRDSDANASVEGERKTVTALFADIKGSMDLIEDLDPEEARAIVEPALKLMMEAVQRYGGYVAQSTGDGIFALFGAPVAYEDHPLRALLAALRMQAEVKSYADKLRAEKGVNLQVRVGANTGEVVVREIRTGEKHTEYLPIGHSTSVAARLQGLATPGSIAISEALRKLVEGYFALKPLGPARVKGVSAPLEIYEVTGLGPLRTRLQRGAARGYTKFVGRQHEMETLKHAAELARAGRGQIVAAVAEPGVGKSRLFFEFKAKHQSGWMVLEAFSVSHDKASAYLPLLDLLHSYFDIKSEDDARKRREKVAGRITVLDRPLEDTLPYLFALLGVVEGEDSLEQMDAQVKKRRTLDAIKRILLRESLNQPLIVMFEDLHWIDEQTQEFLNLLADSLANAKILLLVNYRPEYSHQWGSRTYYTQLRLDPLGTELADEMLSALLGDSPDLAPLRRLIIERTEGNPFFMEEMYQAMLEDGVIACNGGVKSVKPLRSARIPTTVQGVLAARIDRLPADAKQLLQTLSVIGREFPVSLVRVVEPKSHVELNRMLNDLQLSEFIYEQPTLGDTEYIFKHTLTREVAYSSILIERRKALHGRIGLSLETLYANSLDDHLAALAHHYGHGNNPDKALRYLMLAGKQALARSAFAESRTLLQKGLELTNTVPESSERDANEFELATALVQVLMRTKGYGAPEFAEAARRAVTLAEKRGNLAELVLQLSLIRVGAALTGDQPTSAALADQIFDLAQRDGGRASLELGHANQMQEHFYRGDLVGVEQHFARWSEAAAESRDFPVWVGATLGLASISAWALGHADSARERIARAIAVARDENDPYQLTIGRYFEGLLYRLFREPRRAEAASKQALAISEEHGFTLYRDRACFVLGWAKAHLGSASEGVLLIRQGLAGYSEAGGKSEISQFLVSLAEAQALEGALDDALATIGNAVEAESQLGWVPDALTCRGELRLKIGQAELAESDFRSAIALAQKMNAKTWELRATTHLAPLLGYTKRRDEARAMLAEIYGWFTEGFDTADLKDANALLEELSG